MKRATLFLRQHVIALLALTLVVGGGAAFAAGTKLPKNSVASKQVKNGSLKGKDLKDRSVTGADLRDGTVGAPDLAPGTADEVKVFYYTGNGAMQTVWEQPGLARATFSLNCATSSLNSFAKLDLSPGRVGVFGFEDYPANSESPSSPPLRGAATVQRLSEVGVPVGGAGFGGAFGWGQVVMFFQTPTMDVYIDINVALCSARASITIDHKPGGSVISRQPGSGQATSTCEASGAAYCREASG